MNFFGDFCGKLHLRRVIYNTAFCTKRLYENPRIISLKKRKMYRKSCAKSKNICYNRHCVKFNIGMEVEIVA